MAYTERAEMAAVSRGTSHASKYTTSVDIQKRVESDASAVSLLESGE